MGTVLLVGVVPLVMIVIRNRPEDMGLRPAGEEVPSGSAPVSAPSPTSGVPLRQAVRTSLAWKLVYLGFA